MSNFVRAALCALVALGAAGPAATAQETPVDPVTGMAIPMLPGQFYVKSPSGCWMITDEALSYGLNAYQFTGSCTFGVVNGLGLRGPIQNEFHPQPVASHEQIPFRAYLGEVPGFWSQWDIYAPRTSTHPMLETMNLNHRTIEPSSPILQPKAEDTAQSMTLYISWKDRVQTVQDMQIRKQICPSQSYYNRYLSRREMQEQIAYDGSLPKAEQPRLVEFCWKQLTRLQRESGGRLTFQDLSYGFYYSAATYTSYYTIAVDGRQQIGQKLLQNTKSCPDLATLTGCEPVWQPMLAPFVARFDDLKKQEAALMVQHRAEQEQRFAPLAKAWRDKVLTATGGAPAKNN